MKVYADTNFLAVLFLKIPTQEESGWFERLAREEPPPIPITWLHRVELCNAFQLYVFRARSGVGPRITSELAGAAWAHFEEELGVGQLRAMSLSSSELAERTVSLSLRHTARHGCRAYDLLHVASALILGCDAFWSFDRKASHLAQVEGLELRA